MSLYTLNSSFTLCTPPARTPLSFFKMFFIGLRGLPSRRFRYLIASESMIPDTEALGSEPIEPDTGRHVHYRYMMVSHGGLLAWATCYEDSHISLSLIRTFISTFIPPHFHCSALYHRVHHTHVICQQY